MSRRHSPSQIAVYGSLCGGCIGCRMDRTRDWGTRIAHEVLLHEAILVPCPHLLGRAFAGHLLGRPSGVATVLQASSQGQIAPSTHAVSTRAVNMAMLPRASPSLSRHYLRLRLPGQSSLASDEIAAFYTYRSPLLERLFGLLVIRKSGLSPMRQARMYRAVLS